MHLTLTGKIFTFPHLCCCCSAEPTTEVEVSAKRTTGKRIVHEFTRTWAFPVCAQCMRHAKEWKDVEAYPRTGWVIGIIPGCLGLFVMGWPSLIFTICVVTASYFLREKARKRARAGCSANCAQPATAVHYFGWDGSAHSFSILNRRYAAELMVANAKKLGGLDPEARELFSNYAQARAAQTAAELERVRAERARAQDDEDFVKWVSKIEAARGPSGRRAAFDAGIRNLVQNNLRDQLRLEAARIEARAALEKTDRLSSTAAKIRTLREAAEAIRGLEIPDADNQTLSHPLEQAIADLEGGMMRMNPISK